MAKTIEITAAVRNALAAQDMAAFIRGASSTIDYIHLAIGLLF